jgi:hypothetical protein
MMMQCTEMQELLSLYHDGELSDVQRLEAEAHLATCAKCHAELRSLQKLTELTSQIHDPELPGCVWHNLEAKLRITRPPSLLEGGKLHAGPRLLISASALIIACVGVGLWFVHSEHSHLPLDFDAYLKLFDNDINAAQNSLLANYHGRPATLDEALHVLKYEPIVKRGLPEGYVFHTGCLLKMPCCECMEVVYTRPNGGFVAIFEHEKDQAIWFRSRPSIKCQCGCKSTQLVQLDRALAASCQIGKRYVTIIGSRNIEEVAEIIQKLAGSEI